MLVHQAAQFRNGGGHVERAVFNGRHDQIAGFVQGGARDLFLPGAHHNLVDTASRRFPGLAEAAAQAGQVLQFQGDVLKNVAGPRAFFQAGQESAAHAGAASVFDQRRQPFGQALVKPGNGVGRVVFQFTNIHPCFQDRAIGPNVRAAQSHDIEKFNVFLFHVLIYVRSRLARADAPR
ncbi:hypothetical protein D3C73_886770 [compost metagenome]